MSLPTASTTAAKAIITAKDTSDADNDLDEAHGPIASIVEATSHSAATEVCIDPEVTDTLITLWTEIGEYICNIIKHTLRDPPTAIRPEIKRPDLAGYHTAVYTKHMEHEDAYLQALHADDSATIASELALTRWYQSQGSWTALKICDQRQRWVDAVDTLTEAVEGMANEVCGQLVKSGKMDEKNKSESAEVQRCYNLWAWARTQAHSWRTRAN